jgi:hypothetical protein
MKPRKLTSISLSKIFLFLRTEKEMSPADPWFKSLRRYLSRQRWAAFTNNK